MRSTWHRFLAPLTPGVRILLVLLTVAYIAAVAGIFSRAYNLYPWLALSGPDFWKGKVWPIVTYALLPAGLFDFLFNWILIMVMGSAVERVWSSRKLWLYCLVCSVGAGLIKVVVQPSAPSFMIGTTPITFGLLVAWGHLLAHEKVLFWFAWEMTIRQAAIVMIAIGYVVMLPCAGPVIASIMLCGGLTGMLFLWLDGKVLRAKASRYVGSERMGRLEI